jgi:hypothetical protein
MRKEAVVEHVRAQRIKWWRNLDRMEKIKPAREIT